MREPLPRPGAGEEAAAQPTLEGVVELVTSPSVVPAPPPRVELSDEFLAGRSRRRHASQARNDWATDRSEARSDAGADAPGRCISDGGRPPPGSLREPSSPA